MKQYINDLSITSIFVFIIILCAFVLTPHDVRIFAAGFFIGLVLAFGIMLVMGIHDYYKENEL